MHSLNQEIKAFSRNNLRKQCTRVTTLTGKKMIETWKDATVHVVEAEPSGGGGCGYVQDLSLDLQVGVIKPWLLLGSQDAAHDLELLRKHKVTHILNVAYGVENAFLSEFTYKTISILDVPETNILSYFPECFEFIEQAKLKDGVVLVHCNAGVSRAAAIVIGFLMSSEEIEFTSAFSLVKDARPSICPNPGFIEQLRTFQVGKASNGGDHVLSVDRGRGPWSVSSRDRQTTSVSASVLERKLVKLFFPVVFYPWKWGLLLLPWINILIHCLVLPSLCYCIIWLSMSLTS